MCIRKIFDFKNVKFLSNSKFYSKESYHSIDEVESLFG